MNELILIGSHEVSVKTYKGQRVVTFKDIDTVHERPEGTARKRFADNRDRFIEDTDFFKISPSEFRTTIGDMDLRQQNDITLISESGYLMLVKSFTDDLAWKVQRQLVDSYFRVKQVVSEELSPQMQLLMQMVNTMAEKEEFIQPFDNWRGDINRKVRKISQESGIPYQKLFYDMCSDLEQTARCVLYTRQRNKKNRMERSGSTKSDVQKETTKIAVIEDDARLKQIFEDIVRKYSMKYIA